MSDADDLRRIVQPAHHEFTVNLNFTSHGLNPWFAADSVVKDHDGGTVLEAVDLPSLDETADVSIRFQDGNLLPPDGGETPAGTEIDMETIREYRIHVEANDGHGGLKSIDYHIRPRWYKQEAEKADGETITLVNAVLVDAPDQTRSSGDTNYIPSVSFEPHGDPAITISNS